MTHRRQFPLVKNTISLTDRAERLKIAQFSLKWENEEIFENSSVRFSIIMSGSITVFSFKPGVVQNKVTTVWPTASNIAFIMST